MSTKKLRAHGLDSAQEYCDESSIHGFQFIAPSRRCCQRLIWTGLLLCAFTLAGLVVHSLLENWDNNPTVTNIQTTEYAIQKFPFPAVTVCVNGFDQWAYIEKIGNAIDIEADGFLKEHADIFEPYLKELTNRITEDTWSKKTAAEAKKILEGQCDKVNDLKHLATRCLNIRIMYNIGAYRHPGLARGVVNKLLQKFSIDDKVGYSNLGSLSTQTVVYDFLKEQVEKYKINCPECFDWDDYKLVDLARSLKSMYINTTGSDKKKGQDADSIRNALDMATKLDIMIKHRRQLTYFGSMLVAFLSTKFTYEAGTSNEFRDAPMEFANVLLKEVLNETDIDIGLMKLSMALSVQDDQMLRASMFVKVDEFCRYLTGNVTSKSCYLGSYKTMLTIMKDNMFQPHLFDLSTLFDEDKNFTGNVTARLIDYPRSIKMMQSVFKLFELKKDIDENFYMYGNNQPFIPYCQLANVWSNVPRWGSLFERLHYDIFKQTYVASTNNLNPFHQFCTLFRPSLTDKGICYTFNGIDSREMMVNNKYMDAFSEVFGLPSRAYPKDKFVGSGLGIRNGLRLVLDAHTLSGRYKVVPKFDRTFQMSLQHPNDFPLPLLEGIQIKAGYKTSLVVSPQLIRSDEAIMDVPVEKRGCKFFSEGHDLELFKDYGFRSCRFECMYNGAKDACGCLPWSYPQFGNGSETCDGEGNICFATQMTASTTLQDCHCPSNCMSTMYPFTVNLEKLEDEDCDKQTLLGTKLRGYNTKYYSRRAKRSGFFNYIELIRSLTEKPLDKTRNTVVSCEEKLKQDIAIVDIYYSNPFATKLERTLTATFTDKLANIGGTLGLFCGVSLLSIVEIMFCCGKFWWSSTCQRIYRSRR